LTIDQLKEKTTSLDKLEVKEVAPQTPQKLSKKNFDHMTPVLRNKYTPNTYRSKMREIKHN